MMKNISIWNRKDNISDKILLIFSDCLSDTIKYCFLIKELQQKSKKIILVTPSDAKKLLRQNHFNFEIYPAETDLKSLDYDVFINLKDFDKDDLKIQSPYLEVEHQDYRLFRAQNISDHRKFNVGLFFSPDIDDNLYKIFTTINDINLYQFNNSKHAYYVNLFDWEERISDLYDLALAIKCMHLVISNDPVFINLAGALGKPVFAMYNPTDTINRLCRSIIPFINKQENSWAFLLAEVKFELENYRIKLREKYLNACINQVEKDITKSKESVLDTEAMILARLFFETQNDIYLEKYINTQKELCQISENRLVYKGNIATFLAFHTTQKEEGIKIWNEIISQITPEEHPDFLFNYACLQCSEGNFDNFLKYYDNRFIKKQNPTKYFNFSKPLWDGRKDVSDKVLLVVHEQGFGDSFLFSRYIPEVQKLFKEVIFAVPKGIIKVIQDSFPDIKVCDTNDLKKNNSIFFDYHIPLLSLGNRLNLTPLNYKKKKWLVADKTKVKSFKKYFSKDKFNIGIFWESTKTNLQRYTDLKTMVPLGHIDKVQLYSLEIHKEDFEVNYLDDKINIINIGKYFKDFSDTAAAIKNCDLVVSTDSSVMNLAGALGIQTFGLFNQFPEWRWYKLTGDNVGWYKTIKPFQAKFKNDFTDVIKEVCSEIEDLIKENERFK